MELCIAAGPRDINRVPDAVSDFEELRVRPKSLTTTPLAS